MRRAEGGANWLAMGGLVVVVWVAADSQRGALWQWINPLLKSIWERRVFEDF
jgi:hypothetical protein